MPVHFYYPENVKDISKDSAPLIIFSHGAFGYYQSNASTFMELASHGYIVASLDHPYHSFFTKDTSGKTITVDPEFIQTALQVGNDDDTEKDETYYYEITTPGGLVSNEIQVDMPDITPVFSVSSSELSFAAIPGETSQLQGLKLTVLGVSGYTVAVVCPEPFEVSTDGETWTHELSLQASQLDFFVRFGGAPDEGVYEEEMQLSLPGVKDIIVPLTATVDATKAFFETFELGSKGNYAEGTVTCNATSWLMNNALISGSEALRNDARSVRMKIGGSMVMQEDKLGGCDSLWFYAGLYNKDTGVQLTVSYSLNGGQSWVPVVNNLSFVNGEWKRYGYKINRDGLIRLKFETQAGTQNKRINIDDIQMSNYGTSDALTDIEWISGSEDIEVYTLDGRYIGTVLPARSGIYIVRQGDRVMKVKI